MSDRELVTIDQQQFTTLSQKLDALAARIGPARADFSLHQVLTHIETTLFEGFKLVAASMNGGDNSQVLNAINNLDRKVDEFMATQEERLQAILVAVKNVKQMLADLKANNPAIEDEIGAIEAELAPAPEPEPGPAPEG